MLSCGQSGGPKPHGCLWRDPSQHLCGPCGLVTGRLHEENMASIDEVTAHSWGRAIDEIEVAPSWRPPLGGWLGLQLHGGRRPSGSERSF